jgi:Ca2+-binding EF-hand superfamily protein
VNYRLLQNDLTKALQHKNDSPAFATPLPPFFDNFVRCVAARSINIEDAFSFADRYRRGLIPIQSFLSVLSSWGLDLTPGQLQTLAQPFMVNNQINYLFFIRTVRNVQESFDSQPCLSTQDIEASDLDSILLEIKSRIAARHVQLRDQLELAGDRGQLSRAKFYKVLNVCGFSFLPADIKALDDAFLQRDDIIDIDSFLARVSPIPALPDTSEVLSRLRKHLFQRKLSIARSFSTFDREQSGIVSVAQLIAAFNSVDFHPSTNELSAVCQQFGNGRTVRYQDLCAIVEPPPRTPPSSPIPTSPPTSSHFLNKVADAVARYNTDLRAECGRLDVSHSGVLSTTLMKGVLEDLQLRVGTNEVINALRRYCAPGEEMVAYGAFCDEIDRLRPPSTPPPVRENPELERALRLFAAALGCRRINCDELFRTYDSGHNGSIPAEGLKPALKAISPYLSEDVVTRIDKEFRDRRHPERFSWRMLAAALAKVSPTNEDIVAVSEVRRQTSGENDGVEQLVNALRGKLRARRKTAYDLFVRIVDDEISTELFRQRIEAAGIVLTEAEFAKLVRTYSGTGRGIYWQVFCSDVDAAQLMHYR